MLTQLLFPATFNGLTYRTRTAIISTFLNNIYITYLYTTYIISTEMTAHIFLLHHVANVLFQCSIYLAINDLWIRARVQNAFCGVVISVKPLSRHHQSGDKRRFLWKTRSRHKSTRPCHRNVLKSAELRPTPASPARRRSRVRAGMRRC